jgi:PadR family transcriptional regulator PadR
MHCVYSHQNLMGRDRTSITNSPPDLLRGTVDLLILRTLANGPLHGYAIAQRLRVVSQEVVQVGESALYPALQRLLVKGFAKAEWGVSENKRKARYYTITAAGKKHLAVERAGFERLLGAMVRVLEQG